MRSVSRADTSPFTIGLVTTDAMFFATVSIASIVSMPAAFNGLEAS